VSRPRISVITTVYNGESYTRTCILSILAQTYHNYEYIIVNDGSTDNTLELLQNFAKQDARIRLFSMGHLGRSDALNFAVKQSRAEYIAVQDFDDLSAPERLALQVAFLDSHPRVAEVGGYFMLRDELDRRRTLQTPPTEHQDILYAMASRIALCHTLVAFRRRAWLEVGGYPESPEQDFGLSISFASHGWELANIPEVLGEHAEYSESFYHRCINQKFRQTRMAELQLKAIRAFGLPLWTLMYPVGRLVYSFLPHQLALLVRRKFGGFPAKDRKGVKSALPEDELRSCVE